MRALDAPQAEGNILARALPYMLRIFVNHREPRTSAQPQGKWIDVPPRKPHCGSSPGVGPRSSVPAMGSACADAGRTASRSATNRAQKLSVLPARLSTGHGSSLTPLLEAPFTSAPLEPILDRHALSLVGPSTSWSCIGNAAKRPHSASVLRHGSPHRFVLPSARSAVLFRVRNSFTPGASATGARTRCPPHTMCRSVRNPGRPRSVIHPRYESPANCANGSGVALEFEMLFEGKLPINRSPVKSRVHLTEQAMILRYPIHHHGVFPLTISSRRAHWPPCRSLKLTGWHIPLCRIHSGFTKGG